MARTYDPSRRCLKVVAWPELDRLAWEAALASGNPLADFPSRAASWRPATVDKNRRGYGRWLWFLMQAGVDLAIPLADRVTPERVRAYVDHLSGQCCRCYTIRNRIGELVAVLLALAPQYDWRWLKDCLTHLDTAAEAAAERPMLPILAADVFLAAQRNLNRIRRAGDRPTVSVAILYRDWFMVSVGGSD